MLFHKRYISAVVIKEVIDPFINKNKADIVKIGTEINVPLWNDMVAITVGKNLGKCGT